MKLDVREYAKRRRQLMADEPEQHCHSAISAGHGA